MQGNNIYISYQVGDTLDVSGRLFDRLVSHFGARYIVKDLLLSQAVAERESIIEDAIRHCRYLLLIVGPDWEYAEHVAAEHVGAGIQDDVPVELGYALKHKLTILPIIMQGATLLNTAQLPENLAFLTFQQAMFLRPDPDFHQDVNKLIQNIERLSGKFLGVAWRYWRPSYPLIAIGGLVSLLPLIGILAEVAHLAGVHIPTLSSTLLNTIALVTIILSLPFYVWSLMIVAQQRRYSWFAAILVLSIYGAIFFFGLFGPHEERW